jgi:hypothetical protein
MLAERVSNLDTTIKTFMRPSVNEDVGQSIRQVNQAMEVLEKNLDSTMEKFMRSSINESNSLFSNLENRLNHRQTDMRDLIVNNIQTANNEVQVFQRGMLQRLNGVLTSTNRALGDVSGEDINFFMWVFKCVVGEFGEFFKRRSRNQKGFFHLKLF